MSMDLHDGCRGDRLLYIGLVSRVAVPPVSVATRIAASCCLLVFFFASCSLISSFTSPIGSRSTGWLCVPSSHHNVLHHNTLIILSLSHWCAVVSRLPSCPNSPFASSFRRSPSSSSFIFSKSFRVLPFPFVRFVGRPFPCRLSLSTGAGWWRRGRALRHRVHVRRVLAIFLDPGRLEQVDLEVRLPLLLHRGVVFFVERRQHESVLLVFHCVRSGGSGGGGGRVAKSVHVGVHLWGLWHIAN